MSARRDAARVLVRIALRNLTAAPARTAIIGAIVLAKTPMAADAEQE